MSEEVITASEIEQIARKDLTFQRFMFRRAWGIYHAIWGSIIAYPSSFSDPSQLSPLKGDLAWLVYGIITLTVVTIAIMATVRINRTNDRTLQLRRVLRPDGNDTKLTRHFVGRLFMACILMAFVSELIAGYYLPSYVGMISYAFMIPVGFLYYYQLKRSFQGRLPSEGILASIFFISSIVLSFFVSLPGLH